MKPLSRIVAVLAIATLAHDAEVPVHTNTRPASALAKVQ